MPEHEEREGLIKGRMISLAPPTDSEFDLVAEWMNWKGKTAALTGDAHHSFTADQLRSAHSAGKAKFFTILADPFGPVGMVRYSDRGAGCFVVSGAVGVEELWTRGFGFEAFGEMIYHIFTQEKAARVEVTVGTQNPAMIQMMSGSGFFVLEGIVRKAMLVGGRRYDQTIWSILREEFEEAYGEEVLAGDGSGETGGGESESFISDADVEASTKILRRHISSYCPMSIHDYAEDVEASTL